jgi:peptidoglycan/xylan/chitin deacetylase (PgdA/CDA1 family)
VPITIARYPALSDAVPAISRCRRRIRSVHVTDAYRDFCTVAWPILSELGIPVTMFIPTVIPDQVDRAYWWDRLHRAGCRVSSIDVALLRHLTRTYDGTF